MAKKKTSVARTRKYSPTVKRLGLPKQVESRELRLKALREVLRRSESTIEEFMTDTERFPLYLETLKLGCHPSTAAARAGLNPDRLMLWLKRGAEENAGENEKSLREHTRQAIATASTLAENAVLRTQPATYLKSHTRAVLNTESSASAPLLTLDQLQQQEGDAVLPRAQINLTALAAMMVELSKAGVAIPSPVPNAPLTLDGKVEADSGRP